MEAPLQSYRGAQGCMDHRRFCRALEKPLHKAAQWIEERNCREHSAGWKGGLGRTLWEPQDWDSTGQDGGVLAEVPRAAITGGEAGHWHWQGCQGESYAEEPAMLKLKCSYSLMGSLYLPLNTINNYFWSLLLSSLKMAFCVWESGGIASYSSDQVFCC